MLHALLCVAPFGFAAVGCSYADFSANSPKSTPATATKESANSTAVHVKSTSQVTADPNPGTGSHDHPNGNDATSPTPQNIETSNDPQKVNIAVSPPPVTPPEVSAPSPKMPPATAATGASAAASSLASGGAVEGNGLVTSTAGSGANVSPNISTGAAAQAPSPPVAPVPPPPSCTLSADAASIFSGDGVVIAMHITGLATSSEITTSSGAYENNNSNNWQLSDSPSATTSYIGKATGPGGSANCTSVQIAVLQHCTVYAHDGIWVGKMGPKLPGGHWASGETAVTFPLEVSNFKVALVQIDVDDNNPSLKFDGDEIINWSESMDKLSYVKDVNIPLHPGVNSLSGKSYDRFGDWAGLMFTAAGTYDAAKCTDMQTQSLCAKYDDSCYR